MNEKNGKHGTNGKPLISLCMIVGNVGEYIERCLASFAPIADEICVVRAIGGLKPDRTLAIAREKFGAKTAEYKNKGKSYYVRDQDGADREYFPQHEVGEIVQVDPSTWPHVDNFAAARQQSFDMASGDYCFWCDSDDVLEEESVQCSVSSVQKGKTLSPAEIIREHAAKGEYEAFIFPYRIFGRGLIVPRERLVRRASGKWHSAVHEFFDFTQKPARAVEDQRVVVTHLPGNQKQGSNERNLRILRSIPEDQVSTGLLYHMHLELILSGQITESVEVAERVLARPDLGTPEKYELFLNLAQVAEPTEREALLHQAYMADPCRREALGLLATHAMNSCQPGRGMAYARQMAATRAPEIPDWNDRPAAYGWVGDDIFAQALRANGMATEAEALRRRSLQLAGGPRIALVHATRGRPEQAAKARKEWLDQAERPDQVEHIFCIDGDDRESDPLRRMHHVVSPKAEIRNPKPEPEWPGRNPKSETGGCVAAWNLGVTMTQAPVIVQMSDDWTPLPQWDEIILERIGDVKKPSVLAISDGHRTDQLLCMAICTRAYWRLDGYLFHPKFTGVYSDNWFTEVAYRRNAVIEARDVVFKHNHPAFGTADVDQTYAEQNAPARYAQGQKILEELRAAETSRLKPQASGKLQ